MEAVTTSSAESGTAYVPAPAFMLMYEGSDITRMVAPYLLSLTYTDYLSEKSDSLELELEDVDARWADEWYPNKGDSLTLFLGFEGQELEPYGSFEIDEIEFATPPSTVTIKALATGVTQALRTRRFATFENATLAGVVQAVAARHQLNVMGEIAQVAIDRLTQAESDVELLVKLARRYGYAFKVAGKVLMFTELAALRGGQALKEIGLDELTSLRLRDKIKGVYRKARVRHHKPDTKELVEYDVEAPGQAQAGGASGDTLNLTVRASSTADAQRQATAALDAANARQTEGGLTMPGDPRMEAGVTFELVRAGKLGGKYLVHEARHRLDRGGGWTVDVDVKRAGANLSTGSKGLAVYGVLEDGSIGVVGQTTTGQGGAQ